MKKIIIILLILFNITAVSHAQFFIEGYLGVGFDDSKSENAITTDTKNSSTTSFNISPKIGYWFNQKLAAGVYVKYLRDISESYTAQEDQTTKRIIYEWSFNVFGRYELLRLKQLSVSVEAIMGAGRNKDAPSIENPVSNTVMGITTYPLITYDLTDRISLITGANFMSLGLSRTITNNERTGIKTTYSDFSFHTKSTILEGYGIYVGFAYKFKKG